MKSIRLLFIFIIVLGSVHIRGQNFVSKDKLDSAVITHQYHCDTINKKHQDFFALGEEPMKLSCVKYKKIADQIEIKGQVVDSRGNEGIPNCLIYLADEICSLKYVGTTDKKGFFHLTLTNLAWKRIYISYVGFYDIEILLDKLNSH